jgi:hypothetical protein
MQSNNSSRVARLDSSRTMCFAGFAPRKPEIFATISLHDRKIGYVSDGLRPGRKIVVGERETNLCRK